MNTSDVIEYLKFYKSKYTQGLRNTAAFFFMPRGSTRGEALPVWPRPRDVPRSGTTASVLLPGELSFHHESGCCEELLSNAFGRASEHIFGGITAEGRNDSRAVQPPVPPYLRARVAGVRASSTPPELSRCDLSGSLPTFGTLRVEVASAQSTPLQYGVDESYSLELSKDAGMGGTLRAATEWGALRGLETFVQLAQPTAHGGVVLCGLPLTLRDSPSFGWRGLLLDTSRHFLPVRSSLLPMIEAAAALKLNVLHLHLSDAHSFPIGLTAEPKLAAEGAYHPSLVYTVEELKAVVGFAHARGVRVVPELDMPAHTASWAFGRPDVVVSCPERVSADEEGLEHGANKAALHPLLEETYTLIEQLLAEMAGIFPDDFLHLGGDEVDGDCWLSDPLIHAWARKGPRRGGWKAALQALFVGRVKAIAASLGKRVILWDDALEATHLLPTDDGGGGDAGDQIVIDVWRDWVRDTGYERRDEAMRTGHPVVWSALGWYLDHAGNTWDAMYQLELPPPREGLLGGETSSWNEHADETNLQQRVLTRAAAVAERLWSGEPSPLDVARQRLAAMRCRLVRRGLRASPVIPDHCDGPPLGSNARTAEPPLVCAPAAPPLIVSGRAATRPGRLRAVEPGPAPPTLPMHSWLHSNQQLSDASTSLWFGGSLLLNAVLLGVVCLLLCTRRPKPPAAASASPPAGERKQREKQE